MRQDRDTLIARWLDRALEQKQEDTMARVAASSWLISEQMTVNHVLHEVPGAGEIFENLFVNPAFEGYDCLDEVAWRHGMEVEELISRLEEGAHHETRSTDAPAGAHVSSTSNRIVCD